MTSFQWKVIIALCKIVIDMKDAYLQLSDEEDLNIIYKAVNDEAYNHDNKS